MGKNQTSWTKGQGGRPPGATNRLTRSVRETVLAVFNDLQDEEQYPKANLRAWAKNEPTEFYKIAAKLIPTEITGTLKHVIKARVVDDNETDEDAGDGSSDT